MLDEMCQLNFLKFLQKAAENPRILGAMMQWENYGIFPGVKKCLNSWKLKFVLKMSEVEGHPCKML